MSAGSQIFFWFKGWMWLIENPKYIGLVVAPLTLGFVLVGLGSYFLLPFIPGLSDWAIMVLPQFLQSSLGGILYWILFAFLFIVLSGFGLILIYCIYILFCAPFHSLLVEAVLKRTGKVTSSEMTFSQWLRLSLRMLRTSLVKALLFGTLAVFAFFMSLVPGFQWVGFVVTAMIFAFDSMDYSFEALGYGFRERFRYFFREKRQFVILSFGMALTLLVPGLTFFALPGAVVGAALIVKAEQT